jgi:hypothetical protein
MVGLRELKRARRKGIGRTGFDRLIIEISPADPAAWRGTAAGGASLAIAEGSTSLISLR